MSPTSAWSAAALLLAVCAQGPALAQSGSSQPTTYNVADALELVRGRDRGTFVTLKRIQVTTPPRRREADHTTTEWFYVNDPGRDGDGILVILPIEPYMSQNPWDYDDDNEYGEVYIEYPELKRGYEITISGYLSSRDDGRGYQLERELDFDDGRLYQMYIDGLKPNEWDFGDLINTLNWIAREADDEVAEFKDFLADASDLQALATQIGIDVDNPKVGDASDFREALYDLDRGIRAVIPVHTTTELPLGPPPTIRSVFPRRNLKPGSRFVVFGSDVGDRAKLSWDGGRGELWGKRPGLLVGQVPQDATAGIHTVAIYNPLTGSSAAVDVEVDAPVVDPDPVIAAAVRLGNVVTIQGEHFISNDIQVRWSSTDLAVLTRTPSLIVATVPAGASPNPNGWLRVTVDGRQSNRKKVRPAPSATAGLSGNLP